MTPPPSRRADELRGFWPGVQLAVSLGALGGTITAVVFFGWVALSQAAGTFSSGQSVDVLAVAGWWGILWLALSAGLIAGLWLGFHCWRAAYPTAQRREAARAQREAVAAAEAFLEEARAASTRGPRGRDER